MVLKGIIALLAYFYLAKKGDITILKGSVKVLKGGITILEFYKKVINDKRSLERN